MMELSHKSFLTNLNCICENAHFVIDNFIHKSQTKNTLSVYRVVPKSRYSQSRGTMFRSRFAHLFSHEIGRDVTIGHVRSVRWLIVTSRPISWENKCANRDFAWFKHCTAILELPRLSRTYKQFHEDAKLLLGPFPKPLSLISDF